MKLTFLGGAGAVTGSRFLLEQDNCRILVDCGLFQGFKTLRLKNWAPFPIEPATIDAIVLTHAHIDHSGYIPRLIKLGFSGKIYCTEATMALCNILLPDCGYIQEEDARYANEKGFSRHHPAQPLYTAADGVAAIGRFIARPFSKIFEIGPYQIELRPAGHILGAASAHIRAGGRSVLFSGDLGRDDDLLMYPPVRPPSVNTLVMESTYGNRLHSSEDSFYIVSELIRQVIKSKGVLLVPAFAVARVQALLYMCYQLFTQDRSLRIPIFVDSPMATDVTELYQTFAEYHKLNDKQITAVCRLAKYVRTSEESKKLSAGSGPMIILSASGMLTGGRVLHHIKAMAGNENNIILLPGYQAGGTRGAALAAGAVSIKIHGSYVPINARVVQLHNFSAHADQAGLLKWLKQAEAMPKKIYLVHGEPEAADGLRLKIAEETGLHVEVAEQHQAIEV